MYTKKIGPWFRLYHCQSNYYFEASSNFQSWSLVHRCKTASCAVCFHSLCLRVTDWSRVSAVPRPLLSPASASCLHSSAFHTRQTACSTADSPRHSFSTVKRVKFRHRWTPSEGSASLEGSRAATIIGCMDGHLLQRNSPLDFGCSAGFEFSCCPWKLKSGLGCCLGKWGICQSSTGISGWWNYW